MSEPALEVVDHVAGMHCGSTAQPTVLAGCGPPPRISTLFCAASGTALSSRTHPKMHNIISFFMSFLLGSGLSWRVTGGWLMAMANLDVVQSNLFPQK